MATSESTRARRFALPDLADPRTGESIEAFLEGPPVRRGRRPARSARRAADPAGAQPVETGGVVETGAAVETGPVTTTETAVPATQRRVAAPRPSTELRTLPGRLEWNAALDRESVRAARYRRPTAVAIVELKAATAGQSVDPWLGSLAGPIARTLRSDSRATDLVARVAGSRFQMLLPETSEMGAEHLAERIATTCRTYIQTTGAPVIVRVSVAGTGLDDSLHEALAHALRTIEAA